MRTYLEIVIDTQDAEEPCEWLVVSSTEPVGVVDPVRRVSLAYELPSRDEGKRYVVQGLTFDAAHLDQVIRALQEIRRDLDAEVTT